MQFLMEDVLQNCYSSADEDHTDCQASLAKSKQVLLTTQFGIIQLLCRTPFRFCKQISVNIRDPDLRSVVITLPTPGHLVRGQGNSVVSYKS